MNEEELKKEGFRGMKEFEVAWAEFFKDKPEPKNDEEDRKQQEDFHHWYNYVRKQSDTGKTPAEMYREIYGKEPVNSIDSKEPSRMMNFEWDDDYDEELIGLIEELKQYDNEKGYKLDYKEVKKRLDNTMQEIEKRGENALDWLHELLQHEETWSCLFSMEILGKIKSKKSIPCLIEFVVNNEDGEHFEGCDEAINAITNIGEAASESLIKAIAMGINNKVFHGYLDESLSDIGSKSGNEFRNNILEDYIKNKNRYDGWFELGLFICGFNEKNKESLPLLKKLRDLELDERERKELEDAIEAIENPEEYKRRSEEEFNKLRPIFEKMFNKIGRNQPCPCGSGKKYKKCCLGQEEK
ncbi:MAG: SEC-C metal-binding domain-containing protein [Nanoarchaeota archaeon]